MNDQICVRLYRMSGNLRKSVFQWNNVQNCIKRFAIHITLSTYSNLPYGALILWLFLKIKESINFFFLHTFSQEPPHSRCPTRVSCKAAPRPKVHPYTSPLYFHIFVKHGPN